MTRTWATVVELARRYGIPLTPETTFVEFALALQEAREKELKGKDNADSTDQTIRN